MKKPSRSDRRSQKVAKTLQQRSILQGFEFLERRDLLAAQIAVRLAAVDSPGGTPLTQLVANQDYILEAYIQDVRSAPQGVQSAYIDVAFDSARVTNLGTLTHGTDYNDVTRGAVGSGTIDDGGGQDTDFSPPSVGTAGQEFLLFRLPFRTVNTGTLTFTGGSGQNALFPTTMFGAGSTPVPSGDFQIQNVSVDVVSGAPAITAPANQTTNEDTATAALDFTVNDGQTAAGSLVVTATSSNPALIPNDAAHLVLGGAGQTRNIQIVPSENASGEAVITLQVTDGDNNTTTSTFSVSVTAVNDAPVVTVPPAQTTNEDTPIVFSTAAGRAITVADVDADTDEMQLTLTANQGTVTLATTAGLTFDAGDGTADATTTFRGTAAAINAALDGLTFLPADDFAGAASLSVVANDLGNNGSGASLTDTETVAISVAAVNDAPQLVIPGPQLVAEDATLAFSVVDGNPILVSDVDAGTNPVRVTVSVTQGAFSLAGTTGLTFTSGDGTNDASMTFEGTVSNVNTALAGATYRPANNFVGGATLQVQVSDLGSAGSGGEQVTTGTASISVTAVNDAPVNTVPTQQVARAGSTVVFSAANGNAISIADLDAGVQDVEVTLNASGGTMSLSGTTGLTFITGDGTGDSQMTFTGTITAINQALNGMSLTLPTTPGSVTIQLTTDDLGNTGSGGPLTDADSVEIVGNGATEIDLNGAGVGTGVSVTYTENGTAVALASAAVLADADSAVITSATVVLQNPLDGAAELLSVNTAGTPLTATYDAPSGTLSITGSASLAVYEQVLRTLAYSNSSENPQTVGRLVAVAVNDGLGAGTASTATVAVTAVNDAPTLVAPASIATTRNTNHVFAGGAISGSDVDAGTSELELTLTATNGTLTLGNLAGLTFLTGDGTGDASTVVRGTLSALNGALSGLTFSPTTGFVGAGSVAIELDDLGATGQGGALSANRTVAVTVTGTNQPPVNTVPAAQTTAEDTNLVFSTGTGNAISVVDPDAGNNPLQVTLQSTHGTLSLSGVAGLTFTAGDGTADSTMTFSGTATAINTALAGLTFQPESGFTGVAELQIATNDQGNTGDGGAQSDTDVVSITITAVNDAPVVTVPGNQTTTEDTARVFSTANGNAISIADPDAGTAPIQVTLTATNGTISLSGITGLTFTTGDGTSDATMTFSGTLTNVNAALNGLSLLPTQNFAGTATLQVTANDQGNTGTGGALSDSETVTTTVTAVNDAPVATVPATQTTNVNTSRVFSTANGNAITVADVDAGTDALRVTLTATNGLPTLAGTTGLTFTLGDGSADAIMTFTGTATAINTALNGLTFAPTNNFVGNGSVAIEVNDQGSTGTGGALSDSETVTVTVTGEVNDPPAISVPGAQTTTEDTVLVFSAIRSNPITISDPDVGTSQLQLTVSVTQGTFTLGSLTGLTFTAGDGTADTTMTFRGTLAAINSALDGLAYTPTTDFSGPSTLTLAVNDLGNTGSGGEKTDTETVAISVTAVNDSPVVNIPSAQTTNEDTVRVFSTANGNAISVTDVDVATGTMQVTLAVSNATATLSQTTGLTFVTGDGTDDTTMTFTGSLTSINAALNGLVVDPADNFNGIATVSVSASDEGNTGSGGTKTDSKVLSLTVTAVNDAPVLTVPAGQTTNEDTARIFSTANGNAITVADIDVGTGTMQVTLTATNGTLTLPGTTGLTFDAGDGTADATMTFRGTLSAINTALNGLSLTPTQNFTGNAVLQATVNDQGNSGSGGSASDSESVTVTVTAVNDAPAVTVPAAQNTSQDTARVFSTANGNAITVADPDAGTAAVQMTLTATNGTLTLPSTTGLTFTTGDGTGDATMTFTGTVTAINTALNGLSLNPTAGFVGNATLVVTANDQGNTGTGGALTDTETVTVAVGGVNDPPVITVPGAQTTAEDTARVFSTANSNAISVADPDAGTSPIQVTLTATNGAITLSGTTGLTFTAGDGTSDATMTFTGSLANVNAALNGLGLLPTQNFSGTATLQVTVNDQGNTGTGGAQSDSESITVTVTAVNDAPVVTIPTAAQSTAQNTARVFSTANGNAISIADVDAGTSVVQATVTATNGTITLAGTTGLTFTTGDGTGDTTMTFTGTLANINTALNGLSLNPTTGFEGNATLVVTANDQGNTGTGGALSDSETVTVTVSGTNDAPVITIPGAQTTAEDTARVFSSANSNAISVADPDAGTSPVQVTLTATNGTLTLAGTTGLTFTVGDGTGDATMTFTGTLTNVNAALNGLSLLPTQNFTGNATLQVTVNDQGNTGSGGAKSDTESVTVTVTAVNDAPVITIPSSAQSTAVSTPRVFSSATGNAISIADVDAGTAVVQTTVTATNGTVTLSTTSGLIFTAGDGTSDATMTFTGTLTAINAALNGLSLTPTTAFEGNATLAVTANDQGNTGTGGALSDSETVTVTVSGTNVPPVISVPGAQSTPEDTARVFSSANSNLISVSDADAGTSPLLVTLNATNGTISLSTTTGLTFTVGDGTGDAAMTFSGTATAINTALAGMSFLPTQNFVGEGSLRITVNDQGATGTGGARTSEATVSLGVTAVNDAPTFAAPGSATTNEDTALVFSTANSNAITINDVDVGTGTMQATVTAANGTATLSRTTGLTFSAGDGTSDATMTFTGTLANINAALGGMSFTPTANFNGTTTLQITANDQGNTGTGGALSATQTISITTTAVNDAPVNTVPGAQTGNLNAALVFSSANNNQISIADIDAGTSPVQVTLAVTNGTLTLSQTTGLTFTAGDGTGDATMTFTGTITNINSALSGMSFTPTTGFQGSAVLTVTTNDQGATGTGGALQDVDTVSISVAETNGSLAGFVFMDANNNGVRDASENAIPGVTITLNGTVNGVAITAQTKTSGSDGSFSFTGLRAGTYTLAQNQPNAFIDGSDVAGTAGGTVANNSISAINLGGSQSGTGYLFAERGVTAASVSRRLFMVSAPSVSELYRQLVTGIATASTTLAASAESDNSRLASTADQSTSDTNDTTDDSATDTGEGEAAAIVASQTSTTGTTSSDSAMTYVAPATTYVAPTTTFSRLANPVAVPTIRALAAQDVPVADSGAEGESTDLDADSYSFQMDAIRNDNVVVPAVPVDWNLPSDIAVDSDSDQDLIETSPDSSDDVDTNEEADELSDSAAELPWSDLLVAVAAEQARAGASDDERSANLLQRIDDVFAEEDEWLS